jgi:altronate dehydratase small subunit
MASNAMQLNAKDNVAMALDNLSKGIVAEIACNDGSKSTVTLNEDIPFGFKFAVRPIANGEPILKYGQVIGVASAAINPGTLVHVHNVEGTRGRGDIPNA